MGSESRRKVTIGIQISPAMTLVMVAKNAHFFERENLDVELKQFTAGKFALQAFLGGSTDFAVAGDVPVCLAALQGNRLKVVSQVVERTRNEVRVVALKTANAGDAHAYFSSGKPRKLATSFGGGPEFFTYEFLKHNHIAATDVQILSQRPEDMPVALATRSVDAISVFDPFAFIAEQRLGQSAVTFRDPQVYSELYVLVASPRQTEEQASTITAVLRALKAAEQDVAKDPERAKQIMQGYTNLDAGITNGIWNNFVFRIGITDQLAEFWKREAEWAKATGKVPASAATPDFTGLIDKRFVANLTAASGPEQH